MENTKYGKRMEGRCITIRAKAQDTRANPNSWETHLVRKRWDNGLLRALSPRFMMMMNFLTKLSHKFGKSRVYMASMGARLHHQLISGGQIDFFPMKLTAYSYFRD